jgi:hypothetical protein
MKHSLMEFNVHEVEADTPPAAGLNAPCPVEPNVIIWPFRELLAPDTSAVHSVATFTATDEGEHDTAVVVTSGPVALEVGTMEIMAVKNIDVIRRNNTARWTYLVNIAVPPLLCVTVNVNGPSKNEKYQYPGPQRNHERVSVGVYRQQNSRH